MTKINVLNESALHKSLKAFYSIRQNGATEVPVENWICDIVTEDGSVIEIQNKNVGALKEKILGLLSLKKKVTIVHPIIFEKKIETYSKEGKLISSRKSPKKENFYTMLSELTGCTDFLLEKKFTLVCPEISVLEKRVQTSAPVQAKNGRRRFKKNWLKTDKALLTIRAEHKFYGKDDYLSLLPEGLPKEFSSKEVRSVFLEQKKTAAARQANLLLWLLNKMGLVCRVPHKGRAFYYTLK